MSSDMIKDKNKKIKELQHTIELKTFDNSQFQESIEKLINKNKNLLELQTIIDSKNLGLEKDLSIMQQALNDVEEKNRFLNNQLLNLKHSLKVMSQFL